MALLHFRTLLRNRPWRITTPMTYAFKLITLMRIQAFSMLGVCLFLSLSLLSQSVGVIPGSFDVTLGGSATYSVPIRVAPGTAGLEPKLSLVYDSNAIGGPLGAGWSLRGLSAITRGPKNARYDGVPDGIRMAETDALYLDGQRLVPISSTGSGSSRQIEYRKEIDDQTRVVETGSDFGSAKIVVNTKGGLTLEFESTSGVSVDQNRGDIRLNDGSVLLRAESRVIDSVGNFMDFYYSVNGNGNYDIKTIRYSGHKSTSVNPASDQLPYASVEFTYEAAPRAIQLYVAGRPLIIDTRLKYIKSTVASKPEDLVNATWLQVSRYSFDYEDRDTADRFVLSAIHEYGEDDAELYPTKLMYSPASFGWTDAGYTFPAILAQHEELSTGYRFAHISNTTNNLPDLLYSAEIDGKIESFTYQNNGTSWSALDGFKSPVPFTSATGADLGTIIADVTGDGRADILQAYQQGGSSPIVNSYTAGSSGWDRAQGYDLPFVVSKDGKRIAHVEMEKWTGGAGPDLLYESGTQKGFLKNTGTGWTSDPRYTPPFPLNRSFVIDVDCSGAPGLLGVVQNQQGSSSWKVFKFGAQGWDEVTATQFIPPISAGINTDAVRIIAVDNSACPGLLVASAQNGGTHAVYQASPTGWQSLSSKTPPFDLVDANGQSIGGVIASIAGDGLSDVFAHYVAANGVETKFAYIQTSTGWKSVPADFQIPVLSDSLGAKLFEVGDFSGDGKADLVFPSNSRQTFGELFLATDNGFVEKPNFAPPVFFARKDHQDQGVRLVDLTGDGLPDVLVSRVGSGSPGGWVNTGAGWKQQTGLTPPVAFAGTDIAGSPVQFVDVDGDGYVDLLYSYRGQDGNVVTKLYRNIDAGDGTRKWSDVSSDGSNLSGLIPPPAYPFAANKVGDLGVRFADVAGTGHPYLLVGFQPAGTNAQPVLAAFKNDGNAWVAAPEFTPPVPFVAQIGPPNAPSPDLTDPAQDLFVQIVDVNGDGLPDIVAKYHDPKNPSALVEGVWLDTGNGWAKDSSIIIPVALDTLRWDPQQGLQWEKNASIQWADVNSDGLPDIVYTRREGNTNESVTYLGTGKGWLASQQWQVPIEALPDRGADPGLRMIDVNGDGRTDLVYVRQDADGSVKKGVYLNTGAGWLSKDAAALPDIPFVDKDGNDLGVRLLDVDGRGLVDIIQSYSGDVQQTAIKLNQGRRADLLTNIDAGMGVKTEVFYQSLIEPVSHEIGSSEVSIRSEFNWPRVYEASHASLKYPIIAPVPAAYVVRRAIASESATRQLAFSYRYGEYRMDALGKASLGFGWRESVNESNSVFSHIVLSQDVANTGKLLQEDSCWLKLTGTSLPVLSVAVCSQAGQNGFDWVYPLAKTTNTWKIEESTVGGGALPQRTIRQVSLATAESHTFELDKHETEWHRDTFVYDEPAGTQTLLDRHVNVIKATTTWGDGSSLQTVNEYADDSTRWYLGRLTKTTVTKTSSISALPSAHADIRTIGFSYDPLSGLLASETVNLGSTREVTTTYDRDAFGNVVNKQTHAAGIPDSGPMRFEFDHIGRFLVATSNVLGHRATQELSSTNGLPLRTTDPNGVEISYNYDGFGRIVKLTSPTSAATFLVAKTEYLSMSSLSPDIPVSGIPAAYVMRLQTTDGTSDLPYVYKLLDAQGRTLRTITEGHQKQYHNHRWILRDTTYDRFGQMDKASNPYAVGKSPSWALTSRDILGRITQRTAPDGGVIKTTYAAAPSGGLVTTVTDLRHQRATQTTFTTNMHKAVITVKDPKGGKLSYEYNAGGLVTRVTNPTGSAATYEYDEFGNRTSVVDPDAGHWNYEYDTFGRVIKQIDASSGQTEVTRLEYDALGRIKQQTKPSQVWTWEYDTAAHGIGKVALIKDDANKYQERHSYDELGRPDGMAVTVNSTTYTSGQRFDSFGRVSRTDYPEGFSVTYVYDQAGFLNKILDSETSKSYWALDATDEVGHVTGALYGNGVYQSDLYDAKSGRPIELEAVTKNDKKIFDLTLLYDQSGDLKRRAESVQRKVESFGYDDLDRLTSLRRPDGSKELYSYDVAGRFIKKATLKYVYASGQKNGSRECPQQLLPVNAVLRTIGPQGRQSYTYDCHGNLSSRGNEVFSYSQDGRLLKAQVTPGEDSDSVEDSETFDYTPAGFRYREVAKRNGHTTETFSIGAFEKLTEYGSGDLSDKSCLVRRRWYINDGTSTFAVVEKNRQECAVEGETNAYLGATPSSNAPIEVAKTWYLHRDQLGSILAITDEKGSVRARYWYDPWGHRFGDVTDAPDLPSGAQLDESWTRGFLAQEHIQDFELIHLNGRVYDPRLAMFVSPDPVNESPYDTQLWNAYTYARNNPLKYTDPSGYCFLCDVWNGIKSVGEAIGKGVTAIAQGVGHAFEEAGKWIGQNWRQIVIVAAVVVVTVLTAGTGGPAAASLGTAILSGMAAGATAGGLSAALYGGSPEDILLGALKGGVIGAASGGALYGIGSLTASGGALNDIEAVAGHGIVGGAREVAYGGNFWQGFATGGLTKVSSLFVPTFDSGALNVTRAAVVGGSVAAIGGGNFANGAVTGAFSYAFNDAMHPPKDDAIYAEPSPIDVAIIGAASLFQEGAAFLAEMLTDEGIISSESAIESESIFYGTPGGEIIEAPPGYEAIPADNGKGLVLKPEGQELFDNRNIIRWGEPSAQYPEGYFRYYNNEGQPLNPATGRPGPNSTTHITPDYQGPLNGYPRR